MEKLAREASEWVKRHNSWDAIVHQYELLYADV
jgi:hypothetical protein